MAACLPLFDTLRTTARAGVARAVPSCPTPAALQDSAIASFCLLRVTNRVGLPHTFLYRHHANSIPCIHFPSRRAPFAAVRPCCKPLCLWRRQRRYRQRRGDPRGAPGTTPPPPRRPPPPPPRPARTSQPPGFEQPSHPT